MTKYSPGKRIFCQILYQQPWHSKAKHAFVHIPHLVHFSSSISGALNGDFCVMAPVGQTLTTGHG
jgi:hypothetical protein